MIRLVAFADERFSSARNRFLKRARSSSFFDSISIFDEHSEPVRPLIATFAERGHVPGHGFGYWTWKPLIIKYALENSAGDDIVVYSDIGNHFNKSGRERFIEYVLEVQSRKDGILAFQLDRTVFGNLREKDWTKSDTLSYFDVGENSEFLTSPQFSASVAIFRNCAPARQLVWAWADLAINSTWLFDDSRLGSTSRIEAIHRHDQSVFSLLLKRGGAQGLSSEEIEAQSLNWLGMAKWSRNSTFPIEVRRDKSSTLRKALRWLWFAVAFFLGLQPAAREKLARTGKDCLRKLSYRWDSGHNIF